MEYTCSSMGCPLRNITHFDRQGIAFHNALFALVANY